MKDKTAAAIPRDYTWWNQIDEDPWIEPSKDDEIAELKREVKDQKEARLAGSIASRSKMLQFEDRAMMDERRLVRQRREIQLLQADVRQVRDANTSSMAARRRLEAELQLVRSVNRDLQIERDRLKSDCMYANFRMAAPYSSKFVQQREEIKQLTKNLSKVRHANECLVAERDRLEADPRTAGTHSPQLIRQQEEINRHRIRASQDKCLIQQLRADLKLAKEQRSAVDHTRTINQLYQTIATALAACHEEQAASWHMSDMIGNLTRRLATMERDRDYWYAEAGRFRHEGLMT